MAVYSVTGLEPNDSPDPGEAASNEPDTGADVQQEGTSRGTTDPWIRRGWPTLAGHPRSAGWKGR